MGVYPLKAEKFVVLGNSLPPFGFEQDGRLQGFSVDLFDRLIRTSKGPSFELEYKHVPFARAYAKLQLSPNVVALHFARSPEREDKFKWVGPYHTIHMGLIGLTSNTMDIQTVEDLKSHKIGVVRNTLLAEILKNHGLNNDNLEVLTGPDGAIRMLKAGRIDLFAHIPAVVNHIMVHDLGGDPDIFEEKFTLRSADFYFAFSKDVGDALITSLQHRLDHLKRTNELGDLYKRYAF